jgi:hypothetical protein
MSVMTPSSGKAAFQGGDGARHQAVGVERLFGAERFEAGIDHREQRQRRDAELDAVLGHRQQQVDADPLDPRHRRHGFALALPVQNEHRIYKVIRRKCVLTHQAPGEVVATHTTHTRGGETGKRQAHEALQKSDGTILIGTTQ